MASPASFPSVRAAPAKTVLLGLTALVLVGHWLALGGRVNLWPDRWFQTPSELGALPNAAPSSDPVPALAPPPLPSERPAPVTIATVRWIAAPPPPEPEPEPPAPEPAPPAAKPVKIAKKPPVPEPAPEPEPVIKTPVEVPLPISEIPPETVAKAEEAPAPPLLPEPTSDGAPVPVPVPESLAIAADTEQRAQPAARSPARPVTLAPNAKLNYDVKGKAKGFNYTASGSLSWQQDGSSYKAQLEVSAFLLGSYTQTSTGRVTPQGLAPERFSIKRRSSEKAAHFEWASGRIRYSSNAPDAPLLPGAQDQLSVTLQLASLLNTYENLGGARTVSLPVSSDGSSEPWQFEVGALALQKLPAGDIPTRMLTRTARRDYDKTVQLWLAPGLGHLPVRMRLTEQNGDFLDLLLEDMPAMAAPPPPASESLP